MSQEKEGGAQGHDPELTADGICGSGDDPDPKLCQESVGPGVYTYSEGGETIFGDRPGASPAEKS